MPGARDDGDVQATEGQQSYVFADINGDDWFYFEDSITGGGDDENFTKDCAKSRSKSRASGSGITAFAASGSETTLINFRYNHRPQHKVLHEGRCNFAGLATPDNSNQD